MDFKGGEVMGYTLLGDKGLTSECSDLFHRRISMWTIGTNPFFILLLTKDELFKGIAPLKEKKRKKKEKN